MKVKIKWMMEYLGLSNQVIHKKVKEGVIPAPMKNHKFHAEWDSEQIEALFPNGWKKIPKDAYTGKQVRYHLQCSKTKMYELVKKGILAPPVKLSPNRVYWNKMDVMEAYVVLGLFDEK